MRIEGDLHDPDLWEEVATAMGVHDMVYDLGDHSHRLDVVQLVLGALDTVRLGIDGSSANEEGGSVGA